MVFSSVAQIGLAGMSAQANRLAAASDNIANVSTTGHKSSSVQHSSMVLPSSPGLHIAGGLKTNIHNAIASQGALHFSGKSFDLAVGGEGFLVVGNDAGETFLTRAGAFVPDGEGRLVNAAGHYLMGQPFDEMNAAGDPGALEIIRLPQHAENTNSRYEIGADGTVTAFSKDGTGEPLFRIPLATVQSPDQMSVGAGNLYSPDAQSGDMTIGFPLTGQFGSLVSGALESSNVDLTGEMTRAMEAERLFAANALAVRIGFDTLDTLMKMSPSNK